MSKKHIIIGSMILVLVTVTGTAWFIAGKQSTDEPDNVSYSQDTLTGKNESSSSLSEEENTVVTSEAGLFLETEILATTISERVDATESVESTVTTESETEVPKESITAKASIPVTKVYTSSNNVTAQDTSDTNSSNLKTASSEKASEVVTKKRTEISPENSEKNKRPTTEKTPDTNVTRSAGEKPSNTEVTTKTTEKPTESPVDPPATKATVTDTEKPTEKPVENADEPVKCSHTWVWKTHTETKTIPAKTHEIPVYDDGWDEAVKVKKVYCSECEGIYDTSEDYYTHDKCHGSSGLITVIDHYIHHEPELLFIDTVVDEPAHEETITVKDYEYCSKCGERK